MKTLQEWTMEELYRWVYAIGERSDRVISEAMETEDWLDYESDERLYNQLETELMKRGFYANGKPIPSVNPELEPEIQRLLSEGKVYEAQKLIINEFDRTTSSDNPASQG